MSDKQKIVGTIEAVAKNKQGILINGVWYNPSEKTKTFVAKANKGDEVELSVEENEISFIKFTNKPASEFKSKSKPFVSAPALVPRPIELSEEEKSKLLNETIKKRANLMKICKEKTGEIFGTDEVYKDSMGTHCNSLFISIERALVNRRCI